MNKINSYVVYVTPYELRLSFQKAIIIHNIIIVGVIDIRRKLI